VVTVGNYAKLGMLRNSNIFCSFFLGETFMKKLMIMALCAGFIFTSCDDDDDNPTNPTNPTANIRVIHATYDAPAVDVALDGSVAISNLAYGISSGYAEVTAGERAVAVTPAGETTPVVLSADLTLGENNNYTVFAVPPFSDDSKVGGVTLQDDVTPTANKAEVRFVHLSNDAAVDAGTYTFVVTAAGDTGEVVKFQPQALANGTNYTVVAHGTLNANDNYPFAVRVFIDTGDGKQFVDLVAQ
jgi:hypothetical protein